MFNLGLGEIVLIAIVALLVFGPERLPEVARQAAKLYNQVRGFTDEVQRAIMTESRSITDPINETRREIESVANPIKDIKAELNSTIHTISRPLSSSPTSVPAPTASPSPAASETVAPAGYKDDSSLAYKPVSRVEAGDDNA